MTLKDKILVDLEEIQNRAILRKIFDFIQELKPEDGHSNGSEVLKFAGTLSDDEATEMLKLIDEEFNTIEGDWS